MGVLEEIEYLVRSEHRCAVLSMLQEGSRERGEIRDATGASRSTIGRVLSDFVDRQWIERDGHEYRLTALGHYVASNLGDVLAAMEVERTLRDVDAWLPHGMEGFSIDLFTDVVVAYPGSGYPYAPVERFAQLLGETSSMRGFGQAVLKSSTLEPFFEQVLGGVRCEYIYPATVFEQVLAWDEQTVSQAAEKANYSVYIHSDLPSADWCGICLFDERVSICCFEPDSGLMRAMVDSASPELYTWAESTYEQYRDGAMSWSVAEGGVSTRETIARDS